MLPHQERVITEHDELRAKLRKLEDFMETPLCDDLPHAERERLAEQQRHMAAYANVLSRRIEAFPAEV